MSARPSISISSEQLRKDYASLARYVRRTLNYQRLEPLMLANQLNALKEAIALSPDPTKLPMVAIKGAFTVGWGATPVYGAARNPVAAEELQAAFQQPSVLQKRGIETGEVRVEYNFNFNLTFSPGSSKSDLDKEMVWQELNHLLGTRVAATKPTHTFDTYREFRQACPAWAAFAYRQFQMKRLQDSLKRSWARALSQARAFLLQNGIEEGNILFSLPAGNVTVAVFKTPSYKPTPAYALLIQQAQKAIGQVQAKLFTERQLPVYRFPYVLVQK